MNQFRGTSGPWKYEVKYGKNKPRITVQIPKRENWNQELILGTIDEDDCTVASCCCIEEHANAKLIAAAPELLEAIQYYFDVLKEVRGKDWDKNPDHVLNKMLNAVKKATENENS